MPAASPQRHQSRSANDPRRGAEPRRALDPAALRARRIERRRRELHLRRLRRDLLEDFGIALALMILTLTITAGLGVVAILEVPAALLVIASFVLERRMRRPRD